MRSGSKHEPTSRPAFGTVTETPGVAASAEQLSMLRTRYDIAREAATGRSVLEIACGAGIGLGYLVADSETVIGSDIDAQNLAIAAATYRDRTDAPAGLVRHAAERLPFRDGAFDVVLLLEAIYYLDDAEGVLREAHRVLADEGVVIVCSAHRRWVGFNPSPFSTTYLDGTELSDLLERVGFEPDVRVAFEDDHRSRRGRAFSAAKRGAVRLGLMPRTMRGKAWLKRVVFGPTVALPCVLTSAVADVAAPIPIDVIEPSRLVQFKVLYARGLRRDPS